MSTASRVLVVALLLTALIGATPTTAPQPSLIQLLEAYAGGRFHDVEPQLAALGSFDRLLEQFRRDAPVWILAGGPDQRAHRELVAATVALEAARVGATREWKWIQLQPVMAADNGEKYEPLNVLVWRAPPQLIEWGCRLFRRDASPRPVERWWQLAALGVAQRSEDPQFLVGDLQIGRGRSAGEIGNLQDEIKHLDHVEKRFPTEVRFTLAQGIARDYHWHDDAVKVYRALQSDPDVGGEAMMRLGAMQLRQRQLEDAIRSFDRADAQTRDPYVVYLARFFRGQALERQNQPRRAEASFRGAAAAVPHAQGATLALATLAFRDGRRAEAQQLVEAMLATDPPPDDPWRRFVHADDRFWPQLIDRLRAEILTGR